MSVSGPMPDPPPPPPPPPYLPAAEGDPAAGYPFPPRTFTGAPDVDVIPSTRWPIVHGCLLGGAIGDALGGPVESLSLSRIREQHGPAGVPAVPFTASAANAPTSSGRPLFGLFSFDGRISEETQLALLTAEALLRAQVSFRARAVSDTPPRPLTVIAQETYIAWLAGAGGTTAGAADQVPQ